jgi:hypothetical protein
MAALLAMNADDPPSPNDAPQDDMAALLAMDDDAAKSENTPDNDMAALLAMDATPVDPIDLDPMAFLTATDDTDDMDNDTKDS